MSEPVPQPLGEPAIQAALFRPLTVTLPPCLSGLVRFLAASNCKSPDEFVSDSVWLTTEALVGDLLGAGSEEELKKWALSAQPPWGDEKEPGHE